MTSVNSSLRVMFVSPEIARIPDTMGPQAPCVRIKTGGLSEFSAALIDDLWRAGLDLHLALPWSGPGPPPALPSNGSASRIHIIQGGLAWKNKAAYAACPEGIFRFQKTIIQKVLPQVRPDIVHCNDYMTGLIVAGARHLRIPSLFTIHNIHSHKTADENLAAFGLNDSISRQNLANEPDYRWLLGNPFPRNMLAGAILAANHVNTVSPTFLTELLSHGHSLSQDILKHLKIKESAGKLTAILNTPDFSFSPAHDPSLVWNYTSSTHAQGKKENKVFLQKALGLDPDSEAPLFYWPSRLDAHQKGCELFFAILPDLLKKYKGENTEVVVVADGDSQGYLKKMALGLKKRLAVRDFDEDLSRMAFGASDFILMPSRYEPCGYPQLIGPIYGSIPIVHDTGGLHDTVEPLRETQDKGCGFLFKSFTPDDFLGAIKKAMAFHSLPDERKKRQIRRIMDQGLEKQTNFNLGQRYIALYRKIVEADIPMTQRG
jgi:starch synthase